MITDSRFVFLRALLWANAVRRIPALAIFVAISSMSQAQTQLYVSTAGKDTWSGLVAAPNAGLTDGPKATLYSARDAVRALVANGTISASGAVVNVAAGSYLMPNFLDISAADDGKPGAPIVYVSRKLHGAVLEGGIQIKSWSALDSRLSSRVQPSAAPYLRCADLNALGVQDLGHFPPSTWGGNWPGTAIELFVNGTRQRCARWPNTGYASVTAPVVGSERLAFTADLSSSHTPPTENDVWLCGFPSGFNWAYDSEPVTFDSSTNTVTESRLQLYANKIAARFYIKNSLQEVDSPGEYYVDKATGLLVWYPSVDPATASAFISVNTYGPLIRMRGASYVAFTGFTMQHARSDAITMESSDHCSILGNTIQLCAGSAVVMKDGATLGDTHDNLVKSNTMQDLGESGVYIQTGDHKSLVPTNNVVRNNVITRYGTIMPSFRAGIHLDGVGNKAIHNDISFAPHQGIQVGGTIGGNNCVVDGNHIWNVLMDTSDNGAIYTGGNDPTQRGNSFTNNLIENVYAKLPGSTAIWGLMLDSHGSGATITGNIIRNVTSGMIYGGGRDNWVQNNVITNVVTNGIQIDDRCGDKWPNPTYLTVVNYLVAPYSVQYPLLTTLLTDSPAFPEGNVFQLNAIEATTPLKIRTGVGVHTVASMERNPYYIGWIDNVTGFWLFTHEELGDYTPVPGSPLELSGFQPLLASNAGAVSDGYLSVPSPNPTP